MLDQTSREILVLESVDLFCLGTIGFILYGGDRTGALPGGTVILDGSQVHLPRSEHHFSVSRDIRDWSISISHALRATGDYSSPRWDWSRQRFGLLYNFERSREILV